MAETRAQQLWRCQSCGHWSHAKKRPSGHERTSPIFEDDDEDQERIGSVKTWCGPFVEWAAFQVEPDRDPAPKHGTELDRWHFEDPPDVGPIPF